MKKHLFASKTVHGDENLPAVVDGSFNLEGIDVNAGLTEEQAKAITAAGEYFPRLQLQTVASEKVKLGKFAADHYALIQSADQLEDLGPQVTFIPMSVRAKAMLIANGSVTDVHYNPDAPQYLKLKDMADNTQNSGAVYGPEFLVYVCGAKVFATLHLNSKTIRRDGDKIRMLLGHGVLADSVIIQTKARAGKPSYTYRASSFVEAPVVTDQPTRDEVIEQVAKFKAEITNNKVPEAAPSGAPARER